MDKWLKKLSGDSSKVYAFRSKHCLVVLSYFGCFRKFTLFLVGFLSVLSHVSAANWPHARGPELNGSSPEKNLPGSWSKTDNIAWVAGLPSVSVVTPIIWKEQVFLTVVEPRNKSMVAVALDRKTGRVLWRNVVGLSDQRGSAIAPVTDGERVFFLAESGDLVAYDFSGREAWRRNWRKDHAVGDKPAAFSSGLLLFENKLYLQTQQSLAQREAGGDKTTEVTAYTLAFESSSGKSLWQQTQKSFVASPVLPAQNISQALLRSERQAEWLTMVGDWLISRDLKTGNELWRWHAATALRSREGAFIISGGGITMISPQKGGIIHALKAGGTNVVWRGEAEGLSSGGPAPMYLDGDFFVLGDETKTLARIEAQTGQVKWKKDLPGQAVYTSSPVAADGKIYCENEAGDVLMASVEDGSILGLIHMGEDGQSITSSAMAISQGQLFIRTQTKLYCVGKNELPAGPTGLSSRPDDSRIGQPEGLKRRLPL